MAEDHPDRRAISWLRRLSGLPVSAQRAALAVLALWNPTTADRARRLLASDSDRGSILDHPPHLVVLSAGDAHPMPDTGADARIGRKVGAWRIKRIIGKGGMGTVYLASRDDGTYDRDVALKYIRSELASPQLQAAFQKERNALAALNHRDIVPILDGGLDDDGAPWFVMPLIDGAPIDAWCDGHQLAIRDRIGVFVLLCDALAYAHKRGVLHQDIKASAVLVTADGHPKLLDFGLADMTHARDDPAPDTQARHLAFSADYAAPELLRGGGPSTAIDIHALGVLLYRLICGRWPSTASPLHASLSAVIEKEATPPSRLALHLSAAESAHRGMPTAEGLGRLLSGDLDCIAMKCIAHDPEERYPTVDALRDDLQRWLEKRPISLRTQTGYRAKRFLQRNAVPAGAASAILVAALATGVAVMWQQAQAAHESELSSRVDQIFSQALGSAALSRAGDLPMSSSQLLDRTEANVRRHSAKDSPDVLARGLSILARSQADTGNYAKAEALALESRRLGDDTALQFAFNQATLARLHNLRAEHAKAEQASLVGLDRLRFGLSRQDRLAAIQLRMQLAIAQSGKGRPQEAMASLNAAIRDAAALDSPPGRLALAQMLILRGSWYRQRLMLSASEQDLTQAITYAEGIEPRIVDDARESLMRTVRASRKPGREARALAMANDLLESRRQTLGEDHPETGVAWGELAFLQMHNENTADAEASVQRASDILLATVGDRHPAYARILMARSHLLTSAGKLEDAIAQTEIALDILQDRYGDTHERTLEARFLLASQYWWRSSTDPDAWEIAISTMESTIDTYIRKNGEVSATHRMAYASMLSGAGRMQEAEREIKQARQDATHQYGSGSQEMLHIRLTECMLLVANGTDGARVERELDQLIEDVGRVDSLYARAILVTAYLEKAKWLRPNDVIAARETLLKARDVAVKANQPSWISDLDQQLERLEQ
ncbi:serine/threonine-protein kinase [Pseudoxanthomonas putridarboris]|uniref:Serine/threonine-protein kinase n=1 Tax=Pseudoxanthomonas putridarboris TaxID=752605 RepID=A0ABU9IX54_9GAMM